MTTHETAGTSPPNAEAHAVVNPETVDNLILRHVLLAAGAGMIPLPLVDLAAVTGVNIKLLRDLANLYHVEFRPELARSAVMSLLATLGGEVIALGPISSLLKAIPGIGSAVGGIAMPGMMGGVTYAVGRVFVRHFESGGSFLDFDTTRFSSMFKREAAEGAQKATEHAAGGGAPPEDVTDAPTGDPSPRP